MYHEYPWILRKPIYVTFVDGSCSLYNVKSVLKCLGNKLFIDDFFAYGDDNVLGLMLWNCGYKLIGIPEIVASHVGGLTFGRESNLSTYLWERNRIALALTTNTRYRHFILLHILRDTIVSIMKAKFLKVKLE